MVALTRNAGPKLLNEQQGGRFDHRAQCMHARCGIGAVDNAASHVDDRFIIRPGTTAPRLLPLQTSRRAGQALRDGSFQSTPVTRPESCDWQQWVVCWQTRTTADRHPILLALARRTWRR